MLPIYLLIMRTKKNTKKIQGSVSARVLTCQSIVTLHVQQKPAKEIASIVGVHPRTVRRIVEKFVATGSVEDLPRGVGRPSILTDRDKRQAERSLITQETKNAAAVKRLPTDGARVSSAVHVSLNLGSGNTITISKASGWGADVDAVRVPQS